MQITHLSYIERANYCLSLMGKRFLQLVEEKKTNIALSADVTTCDKLLQLANDLGPHICMLKTHIDILSDYAWPVTIALQKLAAQHRFFLFEDRKFADIGNTVTYQYEGGIYQIAQWADIVNAHILPGPGIVKSLAESGRKKNRGLLLIAEMSSTGHFMDKEYKKNTLKIAEQYPDFVIGFITQRMLSADPHWIYFTPGIQLENGQDKLGQQYITPETAILKNGTDIAIIGRGIIAAKDPLEEVKKYRHRAWQAYLKRCI